MKANAAAPPLQPPPAAPAPLSIYSTIYLDLQFPTRLLQIRAQYSHFLSTIIKHSSRFRGPSLFTVSPIISRPPFPKYLTATCSLSDEPSTSEVAGGPSTAKSFRETDEKGFRESETEVLKQLSSMGPLVLCAGDGAVQRSSNLALLRHGISLWNDVPLDMVARGMSEDHAPESHSEVLSQLIATYEEMRGAYATADATISLQKVCAKLGYDGLDSVTKEDMALEVIKELEKLTRVKKMMEEATRPF